MPLYLIERNFADELDITKESVDHVERINDDEGVRWIYSFLSADKKKTYCLYEASSAEAIRTAARKAEIPADVVIEVGQVAPEMFGLDARVPSAAS